ncbi:MAG TPA: hypothetical protein VMU71_01005 [Terracidiphilus sp.]|nr:hypothetical protein [Terracidiphilus sp.]
MLLSVPGYAASCLTQAQMTAAERNDLAASARILLSRVQNGDVNGLKAGTLPAVASDFSGIAASVEQLHPLIQSATVTVDDLYDLDASTDQPNQQNTQFFCGSPVVVLNFSGLPPGKYALAILHATGVQKPQQISFILARSGSQWMLAGFFAKPMVEDGHDGLWYWVSARRFKQQNGRWAAWIYYRMAANLLDPLDNLTSPNLQKLQTETEEVKPADFPSGTPVTINSSAGPIQVTSVDTSTTFGGLDLDVHYVPDATQAAQLSNPPLARQQVLDVMNALLQAHPELHQAFHGIWVHADQGNATLFALELPMNQITGSGAGSPVAR